MKSDLDFVAILMLTTYHISYSRLYCYCLNIYDSHILCHSGPEVFFKMLNLENVPQILPYLLPKKAPQIKIV